MKVVYEKQISEYYLLTLRGNIAAMDLPTLKQKLDPLSQQKQSLILDFEECERVHSACATFLLDIQSVLNANGCELYICNVPVDFLFILQLTRAARFLKFYSSIDEIIDPQTLEALED